MSFQFNVNFDIRQATRELTEIQRRIVPAAASRALNRTAITARTQAARRLPALMGQSGLSSSGFKQSIKIIKSRPNTLRAIVKAEGKAIPLIRFSARKTKRGVVASAYGRRKLYRGTFLAKGKYGRGVFKRTGDQRGQVRQVKRGRYAGKRYKVGYPINELYGPGVAEVFEDPRIFQLMREVVRREFPRAFEREITFSLL